MQAEKRNMERMAEAVPDSDEQVLQNAPGNGAQPVADSYCDDRTVVADTEGWHRPVECVGDQERACLCRPAL